MSSVTLRRAAAGGFPQEDSCWNSCTSLADGTACDGKDKTTWQGTIASRVALFVAAVLVSLLLPGGGVPTSEEDRFQRITHESRTTWLPLTGRPPALRGCCGEPVEFLWIFVDEAKEAVAGIPFRTRIVARDAQGRPARPAACTALRVDLGVSGKAQVLKAETWRRAVLDLTIETDLAGVVNTEMRIESLDASSDVLLHSSQITFAPGPPLHHVLDVRPRHNALRPAESKGFWPVGSRLEVAVTASDRLGNRALLTGGASAEGLVLRSAPSGAVELLPPSGELRHGKDEGVVEIKGLRDGIVELWLEPLGSNASSPSLKQDFRRRTLTTAVFSSSSGSVLPSLPSASSTSLSLEDLRWKGRAEEVREAVLHAWSGYKQFAWGRDELMPISKSGKDTFGGIGMTILDSMTTLWLMGLGDEFEQAAAFVEQELDFGRGDQDVSVFELVIRGVGGLLGAHALSGRQVFLDKAADLGLRLLPAFNTSSGMPWPKWNLARGTPGSPTGEPTILSEVGSVQLEFRSLSQQTGDPRFQQAGDRTFAAIQSTGMKGLLPVYLTPPDTKHVNVVVSKFAFGALADSYYEYLLKQWVQNPDDVYFKEKWLEVVDELPSLLRPEPLKRPPKGQTRLYRLVQVAAGGLSIWTMDHLSCFTPGMIALGLMELPDRDLKERNSTLRSVAEGLTEACVQMWTSTATGLAPEFLTVESSEPFDFQKQVPENGKYSFLRPETTESLFYLYRLTGDEKYRRWGETIFSAIQEHAKVDVGFTTIEDVNQVPTHKVDEMQSFVMAETFKYLYLLFSPADRLDLGQYVLNTEAHPLLRPPRTKRP